MNLCRWPACSCKDSRCERVVYENRVGYDQLKAELAAKDAIIESLTSKVTAAERQAAANTMLKVALKEAMATIRELKTGKNTS
jgi:hypothetical protein